MGVKQFLKLDHEQNERRWYVIAWGPNLFGSWVVVRTWGRIESDWNQQHVEEFSSPDLARAEADAQVERRLKRGYRPVE